MRHHSKKVLWGVFHIMLLLYGKQVFSAKAESVQWLYETDAGKKGQLVVASKKQMPQVSIRQFCYIFECKTLYQWSQQRLLIQNKRKKKTAILSVLTRLALIEGKIFDLDQPIQADAKEGYWISLEFAKTLARQLALGEIHAEVKTDPNPNPTSTDKGSFAVVIDPGHGGSDLGTGHQGLFEKDIALIYGVRLKSILEGRYPFFKIHLTRENDQYLSLSDRAQVANQKAADLFVSLHVNHASNAQAEGFEVYILNPQATDNEARKLALLENETWLKSSQLDDLKKNQAREASKNTEDILKKIFVDMEQTKYIQKSAMLASFLHQAIQGKDIQKFGMKTRGVKQAMFYVLSQVGMPSTLVEIGFLSNTGDRGRMMDFQYRDVFLEKLANAIGKYYQEQL